MKDKIPYDKITNCEFVRKIWRVMFILSFVLLMMAFLTVPLHLAFKTFSLFELMWRLTLSTMIVAFMGWFSNFLGSKTFKKFLYLKILSDEQLEKIKENKQ